MGQMQAAHKGFERITVNRAATRQFWSGGKLISRCCPIFLESALTEVWQIFFDEDVHRWTLARSEQAFPTTPSVVDEGQMRWVDQGLSDSEVGSGVDLESFKHSTTHENFVARAEFSDGKTLICEWDRATELSDFRIEPGR